MTCSSVPSTPLTESANSVEQARVSLQIAAVKPVRREQLLMQISATNVGTQPIVWDKEFAVLIDWDVRTESQEIKSSFSGKKYERPGTPFDPRRFFTLKPGQSISKTVDLVGGFHTFLSGHGSTITPEGMAHILTAEEAYAKFVIPPDAKKIRVVAKYSSANLDTLGGDPFHYWFGRPLKDAGLSEGPFESNALTIELPQ